MGALFLCLCALLSLAGAQALPSIRYVWSGGVTNTSAVLALRVDRGVLAQALVSRNADFSGSVATAAVPVVNGVALIALQGLLPATRYYYRGNDTGMLVPSPRGTFVTAGGATFTFAVSSCANTGSQSAVFTEILSRGVDLMVHAGDFFYEDITVNDTTLYTNAFDAVFRSQQQAALYAGTPIVVRLRACFASSVLTPSSAVCLGRPRLRLQRR